MTGTVFIKLPPGATLASLAPPGWFARLAGPLATLTKGAGFIPLTEARQIPVGSEIDARQGTMQLITASTARHTTYSGSFGGGLFVIAQERAQQGLTTLKLLEGAFQGAPSYQVCATTGKAAGRAGVRAQAAAKPSKLSSTVVNQLDATATGRFQTLGRYSAAAVRGTQWQMADRCDGTFTRVLRGVVVVRDLVRRRTVTLFSGQSYLAKP